MPRIGKMPNFYKNRAKRILYTLRKNGTSELFHLTFADEKFQSEKKPEKHMACVVLGRLINKGLVAHNKVRLRGNVFRAYYWLTDEGEKVAAEIAKEVDEYKRW